MPKSPYEPPPLPEDLKDLPPLLAHGLHGLGYKSLEAAEKRMSTISRSFANMTVGSRVSFAGLTRYSNCRISEHDFTLLTLFAYMGCEMVKAITAENEPEPEPETPALPGPNSKQLKIPGA